MQFSVARRKRELQNQTSRKSICHIPEPIYGSEGGEQEGSITSVWGGPAEESKEDPRYRGGMHGEVGVSRLQPATLETDVRQPCSYGMSKEAAPVRRMYDVQVKPFGGGGALSLCVYK